MPRTRSQKSKGYLPTPPTSSPPPVVDRLSHKRRRSTTPFPSDVDNDDQEQDADFDVDPNQDAGVRTPPRKTKKVRFSDIGDADALGISSTGLTPHMNKTKLSKGKGKDKHGSRRVTLPPRVGNDEGISKSNRRSTLPPRLEHSSSPPPPPTEVHIAPLRQVLDARMRRRLKRNHLSETVNDIEQDQRDKERTLKELTQLRESGQHNEETIRDLMFELESQRQFGINVSDEDEAERAAMREELQRLKFELLHHQDNAAAAGKGKQRAHVPLDAPTEADTDMGMDSLPGFSPTRTGSPFHFDDDTDAFMLDNNENIDSDGNLPSSPLTGLPTPSTPTFASGWAYAGPSSSPPNVQPSSPCQALSIPTKTVETSEMGVQTDLPDLIAERHLSTLSRLQTRADTASAEAATAKSALRTFREQLGELGFAPGRATASQHVDALKQHFRDVRLALEHIAPGETAAGFEACKLLPALLEHVHEAQCAADEAYATARPQSDELKALRASFNDALTRTADLENRQTVLLAQVAAANAEATRRDTLIDDLNVAADARQAVLSGREDALASANEMINALRKDVEEAETSASRLSEALASYRDEAEKLEGIVHSCEASEAKAKEHRDEAKMLVERLLKAVRDGTRIWEEDVGPACRGAEEFLRRVNAADETQAQDGRARR